MKTLHFFLFAFSLSLFFSACKNDQNDYGEMKGVNHFSRNEVFSTEQVSFDNSTGIPSDTLKRNGILSVDANTFSNSDGSSYSGKVVLEIREDFVRGFMALNSIPSVSEANPLYNEGAIYLRAVDLTGSELKIVNGKHLNFDIPGSIILTKYKMYYGEDNVKDPSPANTSLFNWAEATSDSVVSYYNSQAGVYYYKLNPTQLGWVSCARVINNSTSVGLRVRVKGYNPIFASNTAVYVIPKFSKSAFRLWNYESTGNLFSLDKPYLNLGDKAYVIAIGYVRHFKIYYAKDLITIGSNTAVELNAQLVSASDIVGDLGSL